MSPTEIARKPSVQNNVDIKGEDEVDIIDDQENSNSIYQ